MPSPLQLPTGEQEERPLRAAFRPVLRRSLSDQLAARIRAMIQAGDYRQGDRLPAIMEMARRFGVGHPTVREALKQLETIGVVEIRHGAGVFVSRSQEVLVLASPDYPGAVTRQLLVELVETRLPLEVAAVREAARRVTAEDLALWHRQLAHAGAHLADAGEVRAANLAFHGQIAAAAGNAVRAQILGVLQKLFAEERQLILDAFRPRAEGHREHLELLAALESRDQDRCASLMRQHLEGVRDALLRWNPAEHPVSGVAG